MFDSKPSNFVTNAGGLVNGQQSSTRWGIPRAKKADYDRIRFFETKGRDKWAYDKIDEQINSNSEFRDKTNRETFFEGARQDNSTLNTGSMHTPKHYRLHDYFDEYTKPGVNKKVAACLAVHEVWKNDDSFPGETWAKDRPGFRGVPKELLNRSTYYSFFSERFENAHKVAVELRPRPWCPHWPPPGYKMTRMQCKKEFTFGVEDPTLVAEVERFNWYKAWQEQNGRLGWREIFLFFTNLASFVWLTRNHNELTVMRAHVGGMMYPGRHFIRSNGTPKNWETGCFWFQRDLSDFPTYCRRAMAPYRSWYCGEIERQKKRLTAQKMAQI
jgi:hypothetical protein